MIDLSKVDVIPARYHEARTAAPRLVVVHVNAVVEPTTGGARNVAVYCQRPASERGGSKGGYHVLADDREVVRGGYDDWSVNGAAGANRDGLHVCLVGDANQTPGQWADPYSQAAIENAAQAVAWWCAHWNIAATKLGPVDVRNAKRGICGHHDVSLAYGQSDHYDPGPNFPWAQFIHRVRHHLEADVPITEAEMDKIAGKVVARMVLELDKDRKLPLYQRFLYVARRGHDEEYGQENSGAHQVLSFVKKIAAKVGA